MIKSRKRLDIKSSKDKLKLNLSKREIQLISNYTKDGLKANKFKSF